MHDHDAIRRLGKWITEHGSGEIRFIYGDAEVVATVADRKVVSITGIDPSELARRLEVESTGRDDLLAEAVAQAESSDMPTGRAVGAAKEALQAALADWLSDSDRRIELTESDPVTGNGPTISLTHAIVEVVLSDETGILAQGIVPHDDVVLRRTSRFLELYSPLRLSEEADLIVAKVTGQRAVREIADRSPHGSEEVHNLLAALVATGIFEEAPLTDLRLDPPPMSAPPPETGVRRRRLPVGVLLGALAVLLLGIVVVASMWGGGGESAPESEAGDSRWAVAVDMGCEPQDLQRVLKKSRQYPKILEPVSAEAGDGSTCWRLVWGRFDDSDAATRAIPGIPDDLLTEGFTPHAIELPGDGTGDDSVGGER